VLEQESQGRANKKALSAKLAEMDAAITTEYRAAVDEQAVSGLVQGGVEGVVHKVLTTKAYDYNRNLRQQRDKIAAGVDTSNVFLNQLQAKRKRLAAEIAGLEDKSLIESLHAAHSKLVEAVSAASKSFAEYHALRQQAPAAAVDIAKHQGLKDEFFIAALSKATKEGENLIDWLTWAGHLAMAGNPLHGGSRGVESPVGYFKRAGLFQGRNSHFINS